MAVENKEIGEIVKKCKILLLDVAGTTTSISFTKKELLPYAANNVKQFLDDHWERDDVKELVIAFRKLALEDKEGSVEGVIEIPGEDASKEDQIEGLTNSVKWQISCDRDTAPLKELQGLIWQQGYDKGDIKGQVFDDVSAALKQWRSVDGQKVYIYSSGSILSQKLLFGKSSAGDLLSYIDGHFDVSVGDKKEASSYTKIAEKIGCKAEEILYINDMVKEAEGARSAGLHVALVSREGNEPLPTEVTESYPVIHSLGELTVSNKRKQDSQEEVPAKVPKTDTKEELKSTTAEATAVEAAAETPAEKEIDKSEQMLVDDESVANNEVPKNAKEIIQIEEVTDSNEVVAEPVDGVQPVIIEEKNEEKETKTEEKPTEKMEIENGTVGPADVKNGKVEEDPVSKEATTVITEIEDISDKQLGDVADIIDGLEPVVEEPAAVEDMEELQNVGEVLEKECDEILSKVQDVTNLDNIPLKPLLNPIAEEVMETDNADSNDIVDRILDTELELEMKQCADIDLNTVVEMSDNENSKALEETSLSNEVISEVSRNDPETKAPENKIEVNTETEIKVDEVISTETKTEEANIEKTQKTEPENKESSAQVSSVTDSEAKTESTMSDVATEQVPEEVKTVEDAQPVAEVKPAVEEIAPVVEETKPVAEEEKSPIEDAVPMDEQIKTASEEIKHVSESKPENDNEPQVNGNTTNGDTESVTLNGDANKDEEISSRLTVENGKEVMNGTNGSNGSNGSNSDSMDVEKEQGDSKVDAEVSDIKVKSVTTDETRTDPIEQPTEA